MNYYGELPGLKKVDELELSDVAYDFDLIGVWKDESGYYLGTDSGCSCPTPWESHTREDLTGPLTADQAREEIESLVRAAYRSPAPSEVSAFLDQVV